MGAQNFVHHENGIFTISQMEFKETKEYLIEVNGLEKEEVTDEQVYDEMNFQNQCILDEYMKNELKFVLEEYGYKVKVNSQTEATIYNSKEKIIAQAILRSGYYDGVQLIVETDPYEIFPARLDELSYDERIEDYRDDFVKTRLYEVYTPYNKKLLQVISDKLSVEKYEVMAQAYPQFGGTAFYSKVS